jgi:hypothetical protein
MAMPRRWNCSLKDGEAARLKVEAQFESRRLALA